MLKKYIKQIQNINSMQFALGVILLIEIAYLIRFIFAHGADSLDCDAAKLMTHMAEIFKTGHF